MNNNNSFLGETAVWLPQPQLLLHCRPPTCGQQLEASHGNRPWHWAFSQAGDPPPRLPRGPLAEGREGLPKGQRQKGAESRVRTERFGSWRGLSRPGPDLAPGEAGGAVGQSGARRVAERGRGQA